MKFLLLELYITNYPFQQLSHNLECHLKEWKQYNYEDIGSGLYIYHYNIDENYCLMIGGGDIQSAPMYIRLVSKPNDSQFIDDGKYIDIRTENIDDFINDLES